MLFAGLGAEESFSSLLDEMIDLTPEEKRANDIERCTFFGLLLSTPAAARMSFAERSWMPFTPAAGFFLYVGLMEIVAKEMVDYQTKGSGVFAGLKLVMLLLGFALMALLALWV